MRSTLSRLTGPLVILILNLAFLVLGISYIFYLTQTHPGMYQLEYSYPTAISLGSALVGLIATLVLAGPSLRLLSLPLNLGLGSYAGYYILLGLRRIEAEWLDAYEVTRNFRILRSWTSDEKLAAFAELVRTNGYDGPVAQADILPLIAASKDMAAVKINASQFAEARAAEILAAANPAQLAQSANSSSIWYELLSSTIAAHPYIAGGLGIATAYVLGSCAFLLGTQSEITPATVGKQLLKPVSYLWNLFFPELEDVNPDGGAAKGIIDVEATPISPVTPAESPAPAATTRIVSASSATLDLPDEWTYDELPQYMRDYMEGKTESLISAPEVLVHDASGKLLAEEDLPDYIKGYIKDYAEGKTETPSPAPAEPLANPSVTGLGEVLPPIVEMIPLGANPALEEIRVYYQSFLINYLNNLVAFGDDITGVPVRLPDNLNSEEEMLAYCRELLGSRPILLDIPYENP